MKLTLRKDPVKKCPIGSKTKGNYPPRDRQPHLLALMKHLKMKAAKVTDVDGLRREFRLLAQGDMKHIVTFLRLYRADGWALKKKHAPKWAGYVYDLIQSGHPLWAPPDPKWPENLVNAWTFFHIWLVTCWPKEEKLPIVMDTRWRCLLHSELATYYYRKPVLHPNTVREYVMGIINVLLAVQHDSRMTLFDLFRATRKIGVDSKPDDPKYTPELLRLKSARNYIHSGMKALQRMHVVGDILGRHTMEILEDEYKLIIKLGAMDKADIVGPKVLSAIDSKPLSLIAAEWAAHLQQHHHSRSSAMLGMVQSPLNRVRLVTHANVVADIDQNVTSTYDDKMKNQVGVMGSKGDHFSVIKEFLTWCVNHGHIPENPLGFNPWAAHIRTYPVDRIEELDRWYHEARETIGDGHDGSWTMHREEISIAVDLVTKNHRPKKRADAVGEIVWALPQKAVIGLPLSKQSFNAKWDARVARAFLLDPTAKDKEILYLCFPDVERPKATMDAADLDGILDDPVDPLINPTEATANAVADALDAIDSTDPLDGHWDEDKAKDTPEQPPKGLSTDVDTRTGVNPTKTDPEPVQATTAPETPEDEVAALVGEGGASGSWKDDLGAVFPVAFDEAFAEALTAHTLKASDLSKPVNGDMGLGAFLRHCFGALKADSGNVDLPTYAGSKQFRKLLNSAVKKSETFSKLDPVPFADQMALDHRRIEYDTATDSFLHLCYRLGSEW